MMGEALLDQVVPGIDYFPGQGMRSLVAERRITLNAIDIADHFVDHSEYADNIGNFLGKGNFRRRNVVGRRDSTRHTPR